MISSLFGQWARLLGTPLHRLARWTARPPILDFRHLAPDILQLLARGKESEGRSTAPLVVVACVAIAIGSAAYIALDVRPISSSVAAALTGIAWIAIRLPVMKVAYGQADASQSRQITESWVAGSIPYLLAVTPELRALAWCLGCLLAYRVLSQSQGEQTKARRSIVLGYGFEVVGFLAVLAYRNSMAILQVLGS